MEVVRDGKGYDERVEVDGGDADSADDIGA